MAKLTTARRHKLPSKSFACPKLRAYPISDIEHVVNSRVRTRQFGEKCRGQIKRICSAAKKHGLLSSEYKGDKSWKEWCK